MPEKKKEKSVKAGAAKKNVRKSAAAGKTTRKKAAPGTAKTGKTTPRPPRQKPEPTASELSLDQVSRQYGSPGAEYRVVEEIPDLPDSYGKTRVVALMVDPDWIHVFWEVTDEDLKKAKQALGKWFESAARHLRVKRVGGSDDDIEVLEQFYIEVGEQVRNWYLRVPHHDAAYQVDIGLLTTNGDYFMLASSNVLRIPRNGMSDVIDEKWTSVAKGYFEKIYALSGGFQVGMGSLQLQEKMAEFLRGEVSSGALGSFALGSGAVGAARERSFWLRVGAELIIYGATDPRAKVTLLGEPLKLRNDGTFSVRFALPDGTRDIPIAAESPDGVEEREIDIKVERTTDEKKPVFK